MAKRGGEWTPGTVTPFADGPAREWDPAFSPDGRWLAYSSDESGRPEVYVRPFPGPGAKWQVSTAGGSFATWSRSGREIVFGRDGQLMAATIEITGSSIRVAPPAPWSTRRYDFRGPNRMFDLHPDGTRVALSLAAEAAEPQPRHSAIVMLNFLDDLRRRVAARP